MKKWEFEEILHRQLESRLSVEKLEIEQKYRIADPVPIRRQLLRMGAKKGRTGLEHNELFDQEKALKKEKKILRLRFHGGSGPAWLTLKGPRVKGALHKKRMEIETPVHFEHVKRILELLGFRVFSSYRKYREEYELPDAKVCLDNLPSVGWFVEIEGRARGIQRVARELGLDNSYREERSYRRLLREEVALAA